MDEFGFLYTWNEWYDVLEDRNGICFNCNIDVGYCNCYTWHVVEQENLRVINFNDRDWVDLRKEKMMMDVVSSKEYQDALIEFNKVDDRPVCLFISSEDKSLKERIQVLDLEEGQDKEENKEGMIVLACLNEIIELKKSSFDEICDCCGCRPWIVTGKPFF